MNLRIHAICLALNEEAFIGGQLKTLYPFCSGISILTQYDRDWYGKSVNPDGTVQQVLAHPDPEGKISLVLRRWRDEAAARNHEMLSLSTQPAQRINSHGSPETDIRAFHRTPDYFLIVDADELYDVETFGRIIEYLSQKRPRGMRVTGYQYLWTWNQRIPTDVVHHHHFGFLKPGVLFEERRRVSWNESRLSKLLSILKLPDVSSRLFGFIDCPVEVGVFHHGCYLGGEERLKAKFAKHSHQRKDANQQLRSSLHDIYHDYVPTSDLPVNIREGDWPESFIDREQKKTA